MQDQEPAYEEARKWFSVMELKARGWTDGMITRHLGKPDRTTVNPYCRSGPRRNQYAVKRVLDAEQSVARDDLERASVRRCTRHKKQHQVDPALTDAVWTDEMMRRLEGWAAFYKTRRGQAEGLSAVLCQHATEHEPEVTTAAFLWEMTGDQVSLRTLVSRLVPILRPASKVIAKPPKRYEGAMT